MPELRGKQEYMAANYMLDRAREAADGAGMLAAFDFGREAIALRVQRLGDHSVMWDRDAAHRAAVLDIFIPLLMDAATHGYNVNNATVFRHLLSAAIELHSVDYSPMRVLGATAEGMVRSPK